MVVVSQQGQAPFRAGIVRLCRQGLELFGQLGIQGVQLRGRSEEPVIQVGVAGVEAQHRAVIDEIFLHAGIDG